MLIAAWSYVLRYGKPVCWAWIGKEKVTFIRNCESDILLLLLDKVVQDFLKQWPFRTYMIGMADLPDLSVMKVIWVGPQGCCAGPKGPISFQHALAWNASTSVMIFTSGIHLLSPTYNGTRETRESRSSWVSRVTYCPVTAIMTRFPPWSWLPWMTLLRKKKSVYLSICF